MWYNKINLEILEYLIIIPFFLKLFYKILRNLQPSLLDIKRLKKIEVAFVFSLKRKVENFIYILEEQWLLFF